MQCWLWCLALFHSLLPPDVMVAWECSLECSLTPADPPVALHPHICCSYCTRFWKDPNAQPFCRCHRGYSVRLTCPSCLRAAPCACRHRHATGLPPVLLSICCLPMGPCTLAPL